jgi:secreted trypsin-like serine protease
MKKLLFLGYALVATPLVSIAAVDGATTYIINGSPASTADFDTFVSLYYDARADGGLYSSAPYCGGAIIASSSAKNKSHILTAAHCIFNGNGSISNNYGRYTSVVQSDSVVDLQTTSLPVYHVSKIYYRNDYDDSADTLWANDIAVLEISNDMNISASTNPVSDESLYRSSSAAFIVTGTGTTEAGGTSDTLLQTSIDYINCGSDSRITASHLCFDGEISGSTGLKNASCSGDSGGPVYWNNAGDYRQVGIVSFGPETCGDPNESYVTATTEISDYADWITAIESGSPLSVTLSCEVPDGSCPSPDGAVSVAESSGSSSSGGGGSVPALYALVILTAGLVRKRVLAEKRDT